ncbi:SusC/RagA family TonB-linked outer membrane protein [Zunongwangia endophytica]|uniref:SusC/RagA family TonB-linked outer membrane protein n=1 Tax=Zunongwangia endophytica TaxID=1808945 RepID=A0ABV8H6F5_9FLAO|nr:SusC/RagA family TonB-linked outer membrane protein [Zunongwangia endophytica]MDN3594860.1 SusC/RagA family TonB-linked outer membrane protein [Zunongwangia endophytica]
MKPYKENVNKPMQTFFQKLLIVFMKSCMLILVLSLTSLNAKDMYSQIKIDIDVKNVTILQLLNIIQEKSDYIFLYEDSILEETDVITLYKQNAEIDDILESILDKRNIKFGINDLQIVLYKEKNIQPEKFDLIQNFNISGSVVDKTGTPLTGATIMEKGTNNGTQSDFDGNYSLELNSSTSTLIISYMGFETQEILVNKNNEIDVVLLEDSAALEEVVIVGYGTSRVKDLTGAVTRVTEESFNKGVITSPDQLVQGKVAGVNVVNNSGAPGGEVTFRIRGASSVRSGNQPLFVVDGVPLSGRNTKPNSTAANGGLGNTAGSNPLNFINPNDIETIDILKDASATAIYGSRGANGVVLITTKKGKRGEPSINLVLDSGISFLSRKPEIMDSNQFRAALEERELEGYDGGRSVDAFDAIMRTAVTTNLNLAVSGGSTKSNYRLSAGILDQKGIIKENGLKKYTANLTTSFKFLSEDRLKLDLSLLASNTIDNAAPITEDSDIYGSLVGNAIEWNPTVPFKNSQGEFVQRNYLEGENDVAGLPTNPLALIDYYNDKSDITNILGSFAVTFEIVDGLNYKFLLGLNHSKGNRTIDTSGELFFNTITDLGLAVVNNSVLNSSTLTHTLNYDKDFNTFHFNALVGYEFQEYSGYRNNISAKGFQLFNIPGSDMLQNPTQDNIAVNSSRDAVNELQSYFGRINANFSDRFLLTGTLRVDGSTKFGDNNKYGIFPSFAGAWVLSEETFFDDSENVDNLKFRVGWGKTGNQEFPSGASQERYEVGRQQIYLANVANPDLKWETSETYNIGLDFVFFDYKLSGSLEYFNKKTKDLLFQRAAIQPAPDAQFWTNLPATIQNEGFELMLNTIIKETDNLTWEIGGNVSYLRNIFKDYDGAPVLTGQINGNGLGGGSNSQVLINNQPLFVFNMVEFQGFDENGVARYSDEKKFVGDPNPNVLFGANTSLSYKSFDFNMSFNGALGHQVYNNTANALITSANFSLGRNTSKQIAFSNESLGNSNVVSTRYLENADYLRLQNASIVYNFNVKENFLKNLRLSLTGQNLLLITGYSGFDPEVNTNRGVGGVPSFGIDYISYPPSTTILLGLNATF